MEVNIFVTRSSTGSTVTVAKVEGRVLHTLNRCHQLDEVASIKEAKAWCVEHKHVLVRIRYPTPITDSKMSETMKNEKPKPAKDKNAGKKRAKLCKK